MKYYLAEACKNTFILFDCLDFSTKDPAFLHHAQRCLENEKRDDALILTEGKFVNNNLCTKMLVVGLDGALGDFCGNGSRACAAYLFKKYPNVNNFFLQTPFGIHPLSKLTDGIYSIKLPRAKFEENPKFIKNGELLKKEHNFRYVEMIEPHLAIEQKMSDSDLFEMGRRLNKRNDVFPLGINVNAWHIQNDGSLYVKTYERGVQRLTQSCGTGSMSCASIYKTRGTVLVTTPGGILTITQDDAGIELKGPAFVS